MKTDEFFKLVDYLTRNQYIYEVSIQKDNYQVTVRNKLGSYVWDATCNPISYGHKDGLLEIAGRIVESTTDGVEGYLTADDIISRLEKLGDKYGCCKEG